MNKVKNWIYGFFLVLTTIVFIIVILFLVSYTKLIFQVYDSKWLHFLVNILYKFKSDSAIISSDFIAENSDIVKGLLECVINISIAVSSILISLVTVITLAQKLFRLTKFAAVRRVNVSKDKSDLAIMKKFFDGASSVVVFSAKFQWLINDKEMIRVLEAVPTVKLMVTARDREKEVRKNLSSHRLAESVMQAPTASGQHFSFIKKDNIRYILYRQADNEKPYVYIFRENLTNKLWLEAMEDIINDFVIGNDSGNVATNVSSAKTVHPKK